MTHFHIVCTVGLCDQQVLEPADFGGLLNCALATSGGFLKLPKVF